MITISRDELVLLWLSQETTSEMAKRLGVKTTDILSAWRKMKVLGQLPSGDRPRSRQSHYNELANSNDGRPSIDQDYDPLLEKLRAVHPEKMEDK